MFLNLEILLEVLIPFGISLVLGPIVIPLLRKLEIGQSVRKEGPKSHYKKSGTPTMGGLIFIVAFILGALIFTSLNSRIVLVLLSTFLFGLVGFIDDYLIVVRKDNKGLSAKKKLVGQFAIAIGLSLFAYKNFSTDLIIPFAGGRTWNMGIFYLPFMVFVLVATVNSANLTDGLDGLATGVTSLILIFFALISFKLQDGDMSSLSLILTGSCIGFLVHNAHPAKVFMGDTGSMALGGAVAAIAMMLNLSLLIPIVAGIYFAEALSVIIQVTVFKKTGKRVFLMAPLHHHFEQKGWKETKVVHVFWLVTAILCIVGWLSIRVI